MTTPTIPQNEPVSTPAAGKPQCRRVGRVTTGLALVAVGIAILLMLLWPNFHVLDILKFTPLFLVMLGIEVLYDCARHAGDENSKVDLPSVLMCFFLIAGALALAMVAVAGQLYLAAHL